MSFLRLSWNFSMATFEAICSPTWPRWLIDQKGWKTPKILPIIIIKALKNAALNFYLLLIIKIKSHIPDSNIFQQETWCILQHSTDMLPLHVCLLVVCFLVQVENRKYCFAVMTKTRKENKRELKRESPSEHVKSWRQYLCRDHWSVCTYAGMWRKSVQPQ